MLLNGTWKSIVRIVISPGKMLLLWARAPKAARKKKSTTTTTTEAMVDTVVVDRGPGEGDEGGDGREDGNEAARPQVRGRELQGSRAQIRRARPSQPGEFAEKEAKER